MKILIDSSYFQIYNYGSLVKYYKFAEKEVDLFSDEFMEHYVKTWCDKIEKIYKKFKPDSLIFCRDDLLERLWRKELYPNYKGHRINKETDSSLFLKKFYRTHFKFLTFRFNILGYKLTGLEGDDIIANLSAYYDKEPILIIANDKDMLQLLNERIRMASLKEIFQKDIKYFEKMDVSELIIHGDSSDNIKRISKEVNNIQELKKYRDKERFELYYKLFSLNYSQKIFNQLFKYFMGNKYLYIFNKTLTAKVVNRPSKTIKSPYLADIILNGETEQVMAHTPSLGMCGYISPGAEILLEKIPDDQKRKTRFNILSVKAREKEINTSSGYVWIGANPLFANKLFRILLDQNMIPNISDRKYLDVKAEFKVGQKRLDYFIYDNFMKQKIFIEIKHLPIVDFESEKPLKIQSSLKDYKGNYKRCSVFPDGSTGNKKEGCISIRAYQHLEELENMVKLGDRSILFMFSLRDDVHGFYPNYKRDKKYSKKFYQCLKNGVEIQGHKFKFDKRGIRYGGQIPIIPEEELPNF